MNALDLVTAESDRAARVRSVALMISPGTDLDDLDDVVYALYRARLCAKDFGDILDEVIAQARENRKVET